MKLKHWMGYGTINAERIKEKDTDLTVKLSGNHECGLERDDDYDMYRWLYKRFKKNAPDYYEWRRNGGIMEMEPGWDYKTNTDYCYYRFKKEEY